MKIAVAAKLIECNHRRRGCTDHHQPDDGSIRAPPLNVLRQLRPGAATTTSSSQSTATTTRNQDGWIMKHSKQQHHPRILPLVSVTNLAPKSKLVSRFLLPSLLVVFIIITASVHEKCTAFQSQTTVYQMKPPMKALLLPKNVKTPTSLSYSLELQQPLECQDVSYHHRHSGRRIYSLFPPTDSTTTAAVARISPQMLLHSSFSKNIQPLLKVSKQSIGSSIYSRPHNFQSSTYNKGSYNSNSRTRGILGFQIHSKDETVSSMLSSTMQEHQRADIADYPNDGSITDYQFPSPYKTDPASTTNPRSDRMWNHHPHSKNVRWNSHHQVNTRLQANVISNVDSMAWNLPQALIGSTSSSSSSVAMLENDSTSLSSTSPSVIVPWIPTENDIDKLTVVQLKNELGLRALKKVGNKYLLQNRFKEWIQQSSSRNINTRKRDKSGTSPSTKVTSFLENELPTWGIDSSSFLHHGEMPPITEDNSNHQVQREDDDKRSEEPLLLNVDSLQEWARTVDLEPLLHRREAIHREKLVAPPKQSPQNHRMTPSVSKELPSDLRKVIQKMFDQPSSIYSNWEVKQMYAAAKHADQMGDRALSKRILYELKTATPNDARIYRRIARMELEDNNDVVARSILQEGIQLHPENAYLWHGLGQLEGTLGNVTAQRINWEKAIEVDPYVPNSYHALGILDHTCGRVANAMKILKKGIHYCPTNHRLHHALGDIYRDAKMLPLARLSYQKAIQHGPLVSHGFAYTALSYVAYEEGHIDQCRHYLRKAVHLNNGRHANGWVALAQMEESEGNIEAARTACMVGIGQYERGLIEQSRRTIQQQNMIQTENIVSSNRRTFSLSENPVTLRNKMLQTIPTYRSGDRFFNVYRNWLRLEERFGTIETFEEVYERAIVAFPHEYKIMIDAAQHFVRLNLYSRARAAFTKACCVRANHLNLNGEPYRLFAEFEMQMGNHIEAQKILYSGAMTLSKYLSSSFNANRRGVPQLFLTWAVCEWHLNNPTHAEKLFDYALRLTSSDVEEAPKLRSMILYSMARFEYDRKELRRAQHYIGLCLKEHALVGGQSQVWDLWATVAYEMGNVKLAHQCQEQSSFVRANRNECGDGANDSRHIEDSIQSLSDALKSSAMNDRPDMYQYMRRDPWHTKIFTSTNINEKNIFLNVALLPQNSENNVATIQYR